MMPSRREAAPISRHDYLMIKSLTVSNFRCFKKAHLADLKRVNIVVGRNATGKTVLLESLFLAAGGSPLVVLKLRQMRGMGEGVRIDNITLPRIWEDLFCGFDTHQTIEIRAIGTAHDSRSLLISNAGTGSLTLPLNGQTEDAPSQSEAPIQFTWRVEGQPEFSTRPKMTPQGLNVESLPSPTQTIMFPANYTLNPEETSQRLSDIRRKNQLPLLLETLRKVFPDVVEVSVENNAGVWMVYISTPHVSSQMIPMALHSAGVNRFIACLLGIASAPRGVVLIDEIENGLYYKTLEDVWRAIHRFADEYKTQVFITTHSKECLNAAKAAVHNAPSDFSLIRANLDDSNDRWLDLFSGEKLEGALETGFELR
jgi:hypothetical protein